MPEQLKPCAYCGSTAILAMTEEGPSKLCLHWYSCTNCGTDGPRMGDRIKIAIRSLKINKPLSNCCNAEVHLGNDTDPSLPINGMWCRKCHKRCGIYKKEKSNAKSE